MVVCRYRAWSRILARRQETMAEDFRPYRITSYSTSRDYIRSLTCRCYGVWIKNKDIMRNVPTRTLISVRREKGGRFSVTARSRLLIIVILFYKSRWCKALDHDFLGRKARDTFLWQARSPWISSHLSGCIIFSYHFLILACIHSASSRLEFSAWGSCFPTILPESPFCM